MILSRRASLLSLARIAAASPPLLVAACGSAPTDEHIAASRAADTTTADPLGVPVDVDALCDPAYAVAPPNPPHVAWPPDLQSFPPPYFFEGGPGDGYVPRDCDAIYSPDFCAAERAFKTLPCLAGRDSRYTNVRMRSVVIDTELMQGHVSWFPDLCFVDADPAIDPGSWVPAGSTAAVSAHVATYDTVPGVETKIKAYCNYGMSPTTVPTRFTYAWLVYHDPLCNGCNRLAD